MVPTLFTFFHWCLASVQLQKTFADRRDRRLRGWSGREGGLVVITQAVVKEGLKVVVMSQGVAPAAPGPPHTNTKHQWA